MKTQKSNFIESLDNSSMQNLLQEVKETVATNTSATHHKTILSSADLWNIQRMGKTRTTRRFLTS